MSVKEQYLQVAKWVMEHKNVLELQILEILIESRITELIENFNKAVEGKE